VEVVIEVRRVVRGPTLVLRRGMASLVCATCRKLIPPGASAVRCTVASCNTGRMKLRFCSVACWEKHVPTARHRKPAYVIEDRVDGPE
jgi:LSD1 subclass zinc finger protein